MTKQWVDKMTKMTDCENASKKNDQCMANDRLKGWPKYIVDKMPGFENNYPRNLRFLMAAEKINVWQND